METKEARSFDLAKVEVREKQGQLYFRGHAAVFNSPADIGSYTEIVKPGAFKRSLEQGQDVLFTLDHNTEKLLARTSSGTLKLVENARGLAVEATLPDTSYARDAAELVSRGDLSGMSFVFKPQKQSWSWDGDTQVRSLEDVDLFDVSLVTMPAYPATNADIELRQLMDAFTEARSGKAISSKNKDAIRAAIATLNALIAEEEPRSVTDPRFLKLELLAKYTTN